MRIEIYPDDPHPIIGDRIGGKVGDEIYFYIVTDVGEDWIEAEMDYGKPPYEIPK